MARPRDAIESALNAVARAQTALNRGKHRQVRSASEIDALKSLAFAWFESLRPEFIGWVSDAELGPADGAFRQVLEATGRYSARPTYGVALKDARAALLELRTALTTAKASHPKQATPEPPPNFGALAADARMQEILTRRWREVEKCIDGGAYLAATVMMGGLLESLFLARVNRVANKKPIFTARTSPKDKAGNPSPLSEWTLKHYIDVAHELLWISKSAKEIGGVLREFRNYIHPHKEYSDAVALTKDDAEMFWTVTRTLARQMLASVALAPV